MSVKEKAALSCLRTAVTLGSLPFFHPSGGMKGLDWVTSGLPALGDSDSMTPRPRVLRAKLPAVCLPLPGAISTRTVV